MITLGDAKTLKHGNMIHHNTNIELDGSCQRWKVEAPGKKWHRSHHRVTVPITHGKYGHNCLTDSNLGQFHRESDCHRQLEIGW